MPRFCHFIARNRLSSTISTGCRPNVLGCINFINGPIAIKFYIDTQRIISFHFTLRLPDSDKIQKSWLFAAEGPWGHSLDSKGPQGSKSQSIFWPTGSFFILKHHRSDLRKVKQLGPPPLPM